MANEATPIVLLSGDHRSKKRVPYIPAPEIGRHVLNLGGYLEKGEIASFSSVIVFDSSARVFFFTNVSEIPK